MKTLIEFITGIYLLFLTIEDVKKRTVPLACIIIFSGSGIFMNYIFKYQSLSSLFLGIGVGAVVIVLGKVTRGGVGLGDGAVLGSIGIVIGGEKGFLLFFISIFMSAIFSLIFLSLKKVKWKQELPFLPYILCTYIILSIWD